jgi:hypothetical protein
MSRQTTTNGAVHGDYRTEGDESNAEDSKTMQENNNDTPVLGSTVSKKTIFSILENIAYTTYLI